MVSITFRLSALSAQTTGESGITFKLLSQLPFGSVPFRHFVYGYDVAESRWLVSITFRLSALSARWEGVILTVRDRPDVSITFRLSALSARTSTVRTMPPCWRRLNYLSAQCPFGTWGEGPAVRAFGSLKVSITFRLSALSARDIWFVLDGQL